MKLRVPSQEVDQRKLGKRLWKKPVKACGLNREDAMDCSRWRKLIGMIDDHDECEWCECFFWYWVTRVIRDKIRRAVKRLCVCVCANGNFGREYVQLGKEQIFSLGGGIGQLVQCNVYDTCGIAASMLRTRG